MELAYENGRRRKKEEKEKKEKKKNFNKKCKFIEKILNASLALGTSYY